MPVHDWRKVIPGIFHDFHNAWIAELRKALNRGLLPPDFYALSEQMAGRTEPVVLTLQRRTRPNAANGEPRDSSTLALASSPPRTRTVEKIEGEFYVSRRKTLVLRHRTDDRIVAMIEILSPGNKSSQRDFRQFLNKAIAALTQNIHLLIVDLFPPTKRDPQGIHGALLARSGDKTYRLPPGKPLVAVSYFMSSIKQAYVEPLAVGDDLPAMPLFLDQNYYVPVPLSATYQEAWTGVPGVWQRRLES